MADEKGGNTITVTSLRPHTYDGVNQPVGSTYQARAEDVETLRNQCMAIETEKITTPAP